MYLSKIGLLLISAILTKLISGSGSGIYLEEECDRIRRPIHKLSKGELMLYVEGLQEIRANGKYQDILVDHATHTMIHRGSSFFFWHTYLVWEVETQIRALGGKFACFALPYYDLSVDAGHETETVILNSVFGGDGNPENNYCVDGPLWSVEMWPIVEQNLCAETEDAAIGCCLKRAVEPTILLPTATEIAEVMSREEFIAFKGGIVLFHQYVHWFFAQCDECAMATGYSPDDPIFMVLHSFVAYIRAMWATCHGYNTIAAEDLHEYPDAYTAECGDGFDECGTIELDDKYQFDILATKEWSITSKMDITPRMLWEFEDWGVKYDIGSFYDESSLSAAESDWCPAQRFESDENRWFLHASAPDPIVSDSNYNLNKLDTPKTAAISDDNTWRAPNIVFILMDDVGWNDVSYNGGAYPTPNIDALYAESISLEKHYSHLMCSPSRSQFITGRYAHKMGFGKMLPWDYTEIGGLPIGQPTIANWLQSIGGYKTYAVGKWHMGYAIDAFTPTNRGFDHFYGFYQGAIGYDTLQYADIEFGDTAHYDFFQDGETCVSLTEQDSEFNTMDLFRDQIFEYVDENIENGNVEPFFLFAALQTLHVPMIEISKYEPQCQDLLKAVAKMKYCTNTLYTDDIIGEIMDKLRENDDLWSNTLVIFSTDNGADIEKGGCNYPFRGTKGTLFDGNTRTIALIAGGVIPESAKGTKRNSLFSALDWTPTLLRFAGIFSTINDIYDEDNKWWDGLNQYEMIMHGDMGHDKRNHIILNVGLQSLESASAVFIYPTNGHLYKYIAEDSSIDKWRYNKVDGWCDAHNMLRYAADIPLSQAVDGKYLFDLSIDVPEKSNLLFNGEKDPVQHEIVKYAVQLFDGMCDDELFHEPLDFLWDRLEIGDPDNNVYDDGGGVFITPFLSEAEYFDLIKEGFERLKIESIELKSLYLNKWQPPNTADVAVDNENDSNNSQQSTFTYLFVALLFVVMLVFIGCLSRLRHMKKGHQYTLLLNGNNDVVSYGANDY